MLGITLAGQGCEEQILIFFFMNNLFVNCSLCVVMVM